MTTPPSPLPSSGFAYRAQTRDGRPLSGVIAADDAIDARVQLEELGLRVIELGPAERPRGKTRPITGETFLAFNEQLAHLTQSSLPIERGLRLIAQDMRRGRLSDTIRRVADNLERGMPLAEAFDAQRGRFPPFYGRLVEAGVKSGNLPGMLFNLGRHVELVHRLRAALWRSVAYPLVVLLGLAAVMVVLGIIVMPPFEKMYGDFGVALPTMTEVVLRVGRWMPVLFIVAVAAVALLPVAWSVARQSGAGAAIIDALVLPMPLVGTVLRRNLIARWCDALRVSVESGLDLPQALRLTNEAIDSPRLRRESQALIAALERGEPIGPEASGELLPATVTAAIGLAGQQADLCATLGALSQMYQEQAETRIGAVNTLLTPLLLIIMGSVIGFIVTALLLPLVRMMQMLS
jgi:type IV pilus assembly protein PilC